MNKDTVVASVIGFGLGLVAAVALWVIPRILPKTPTQIANIQASPQEEVAGAQNTPQESPSNLSLTSPADGEIVTSKSVNIKGSAPGATLVTVSTKDQNNVLPVQKDGSFSSPLTLTDGGNEIVVTSIGKNMMSEKNLFVFYRAEGI